MKRLLTVWILVIFYTHTFSQEGLGPNPPGISWKQIRTPAGRIIFPDGLDSLAFRTAMLVNYQRRYESTLVGVRVTRPVSQIIQNQSVLPAGFSTPAPWRNEYFVTPLANMFLGPVSWTDAMEIHEYRHAQQFDMANQGFTLPYKILMGQTGWLLNTLITQPLWFREGDAVLSETNFTHSGRGRLPSFHMEYKAMRLKGYHYDYEKAHFPSFKSFVPNPYRLGYYMVSKARRDYGNDIWNKVLEDTYHKKGFFYPFSRSMKKYMGLGSKDFYNKTVDELDSLWTGQDKGLRLTHSSQLSLPKVKKYTSYRFPHYIKGDSILVLKSGLDLIHTYYIITPNGKEKKLFSPGIYTDDHITLVAEDGKMVWAESGFHERYQNMDYSIIKLHDLKSGKSRKLTSKTRYFSPALSPDATKVFVTETDYRNNFFFLVLDASDGKVLWRSANPDHHFLTHPRWMEDNLHVVCISVSDKGNAVVKLNTETSELTVLVPYTYTPLSRPYPKNKYVYFSAGHAGINNIYTAEMGSGNIYQVSSVRFGAFEPVVAPDGKKLLFSEYTADGYRTHEMDLKPEEWKEVNEPSSNPLDFFLKNVQTTEEKDITGSAYSDTTSYEVKKFNAFTNGLFNFYGWFVLPNVPEYGMEFYTQNIMSTLRGTLGLLYNTNENRFHYYAKASYAAFYPVLDLEYNYGNRRADHITPNDPTAEPFRQMWKEQFISGGINFPLRFTQGTHTTTMSLGGRYERFMVDFLDTVDDEGIVSHADFDAIRGGITGTYINRHLLNFEMN